jgi:transcriptional regulator with XRE-family HTH domain
MGKRTNATPTTAEDVAAAREIARRLREERARHRLNQGELADRMGYSRQSVTRAESGTILVSEDFALRADQVLMTQLAALLPVPGIERHKLLRRYVEIEQHRAHTLQQWQAQLVPALLQTADYARTVVAATLPPKSPEAVDTTVANRLHRQQVFDREQPLTAHFVLDEGAVRRLVGGVSLMRPQWDHLITSADNPYITIQILLHAHGAHAALIGSYTILEVAPHESALYMETMASGTVVTETQPVQHARQRFASLMARALSPQDSIQFLEELKGAA